MKVQFVKPETNDASGIHELFMQLKNDGHEIIFADVVDSDEIVEWIIKNENLLYIARYNQQIIGVMRVKIYTDNTSHSCDITIAVSSEYRQQGVAKSLVNYGLSDVKHHGISVARAKVFSDNKASLNTLLSTGFSITGSFVKHHYNDKRNVYVDDIILYKALD